MNVELTSMLWGGMSGAAMFALGLYWLWDMKPSNAETEWLRSEVKDLHRDAKALRGDVKNLHGDVEDLNDEYNGLAKRVHALEHPPFEPKFGDWVKAEHPDRPGLSPAVYLYKYKRDGEPAYRCIMKNSESGTSEFSTRTVEPLDA